MALSSLFIEGYRVWDIRFPTSLEFHGSDAVHSDPDYSCAYVALLTNDAARQGHGHTFTIGRGTEIVVTAIHSLAKLIVGTKLEDIFLHFGEFWRKLTNDSQMRWVGPEKGVLHLATAAIVNALWDLWAKIEGKPLWKLLSDMSPEQIVSLIDFRYITDAITPAEALEMLRRNHSTRAQREAELEEKGYPAYTTSAGWIGYGDEYTRKRLRQALDDGFTQFKVKVGAGAETDRKRCQMTRDIIGNDNVMMVDANQKWDVQEAIDSMIALADFKLLWIEEPTSPDDILGHAKIAEALKPYGMGVATGEQCHNRVMFKQFIQTSALQFCQIDSCRVGGVNEIISILLIAAKYGVPVCPHAGGVGLCEMVQHLSAFDYICVSAGLEKRTIEYADQLHEHFEDPVTVVKARYRLPQKPGYSTEIKAASREAYQYPNGTAWQELFAAGKYKSP